MERRLSPLAFAGAAAIIVFQLACPLMIASQASHLDSGAFAHRSDAARYRTIVETPGTPYRDFHVEYPPAAIGMFRGLGPHHFGAFRQRLLVLQMLCQALIVFLLFRVWGKRAMWSYLALSTPMLFVVYTGFDLVAVAVAVGAAALVRRRHPYAGALGFVVGGFLKLWPGVLLPSLIVRREARAFFAGLGAALVGLAAWTVWGGTGAVGQVLTYRGARGWEYESVPGAILRLITRDPIRLEQGSLRLGSPPQIFSVLFSVVLVLVIIGIWWLASRREDLPDGLAETAVITSLLVFATLLSPQFVLWPLPFVAIAAAGGITRLERWAGAAAVLTFVDWIFFFDPARAGFLRSGLVIGARDIALVGLLVFAVLDLRRSVPAANALAEA